MFGPSHFCPATSLWYFFLPKLTTVYSYFWHTKRPNKNNTMSTLQVTAQKIKDAVGQSGSYTGEVNVDSGLPHGSSGTMIYDSSSTSSSADNDTTYSKIQQYQGEWHQGFWHGQGTCELQNGDIYQGEFVQHERHGNGEYTWKTSNNNKQRLYQGLFHHNQRHGHGKYTWKTLDEANNEIVLSESTYVGMFDNGQRSGHGVYHSPNLNYSGDWRAGQYHGYGVLETPSTMYKGYFHQGQKHGRGVETSHKSDDDEGEAKVLHEGQWYNDQPVSDEDLMAMEQQPAPAVAPSINRKTAAAAAAARKTSPRRPKSTTVVLSAPEEVIDGQGRKGMYKGILQDYLPQGVGTITYQQHPECILEYEGFWVTGMKHGFGRVRYMTGDSYQGDFVHNQKQGQGEFILQDGRQFRGLFQQDLPHSTVEKFRVVYPKNDLYLGHYEAGVRSGNGKFTWVDGGYYNGNWSDGLYSGTGELVTATTMYKGDFQQGSYHGTGTLTNLNTNEVVYQGEWNEGLPEHDDVISNMMLHIPQPPLDYDVAKLLQPTTTATEYPKPATVTKTIMSGLSSLVVSDRKVSEQQGAPTPNSKPSSKKTPEVLDKSVCKAIVDLSVWDGQDNPGRYTGILHVPSQRPHGVGRMVYDDGNRVHEGFWEYGHRQGHGRCLFVNIGDFHEGSYIQNLRQGPGTYYWKDGRQFVGTYNQDERHGPGVFTYPNGDVYDGNFEHGQRSGFGTFTFHNKTCQYAGEWKLGLYSGPGELKWQSVRETRSVDEAGEHITRRKCQNRYEGSFENGLFEGEGTEFENDEMIRQGLWSKGKFVEPAYIDDKDDEADEQTADEGVATSAEEPVEEEETHDAAHEDIKSEAIDEVAEDPGQSDDEVSDENEAPQEETSALANKTESSLKAVSTTGMEQSSEDQQPQLTQIVDSGI